MSINFPDSPTTNQVFTAGQRQWTWNGRAWQASTTNVGYTGSAGAYSASGYTGSLGYVGSMGYTGSQGAGFTGSASTAIGPTGYTGSGMTTLPIVTQASTYTLQVTDNGTVISTSSGVTLNSNVFVAGQNVSIFNTGVSNITITQGASVTLYLVATVLTGNRLLAQNGLATIVCVSTNTFVISGGGLA